MRDVKYADLNDLAVGQYYESRNMVGEADIKIFADVSGDFNPVHLDEAYARTTFFKGRIAHGMLSASYISAIIGTRLPGAGSIYLSQSLKFKAPVRIGDEVVTRVEVVNIDQKRKRVQLSCVCKVKDVIVLDGEAEIMVPASENVEPS